MFLHKTGDMGIKNVWQYGFVVFVVFAAMFCVFPKNVSAANVTISQRILPVRFVYLAKDGSISRVWSNVEEKDDAYAVKFFDSKLNEVNQNSNLVVNYQSLISSKEKRNGKLDKFVHFDKKGNSWEEIDTVI